MIFLVCSRNRRPKTPVQPGSRDDGGKQGRRRRPKVAPTGGSGMLGPRTGPCSHQQSNPTIPRSPQYKINASVRGRNKSLPPRRPPPPRRPHLLLDLVVPSLLQGDDVGIARHGAGRGNLAGSDYGSARTLIRFGVGGKRRGRS